MAQSYTSQKRIAINTIVLYCNLIVTSIISFVSSRLVLDALGADDYGLYNVVGGIVTMINILGVAMVSTSYRYLAVELGKGCQGNPNLIFNSILIIHIFLAILLVLIGETLGVYYVNNLLNVHPDKISDALFVLHLSLLTTAIAVVTVPVNGLLIAKENFILTSGADIAVALLKLCLFFSLSYIHDDKLRIYAIFVACLHIVSPFIYQCYCFYYEHDIVKWNFNADKKIYKEILGFTWWILIGAVSCMARIQGAAMIINYYFGTILNAAFGLATQVHTATSQFTSTLRQAAIPQIMKSHAAGDENGSINLVYHVSKYSFLFFLAIALPLAISIKGILKIWLGTPPQYTDIYIILMLVNGMVANISAGFDATIQASGKIRGNQIGYSIINISLLPIVILLYILRMPPYSNIIVMIVLTIVTQLFQCWIMKKLSAFDVKTYLSLTVIPAISTTLFSGLPLMLLTICLNDSWQCTFVKLTIGLVWTTFIIFLLGLNQKERLLAKTFLNKILQKVKIHNIYIKKQ